MNRGLVRSLLLYIVDQLQDMDAPISTIRLVKLLYLVDLECYRQRYETLTGIDWVKHHYGPYFFALPEVLDSVKLDLEPEEVLTERGRGVTYTVYEPQDISDVVSFATECRINEIIKAWAYEDLEDLLKYVYGTLPVKHGQYSRPLDFTYETDHLLLQVARECPQELVTLEELFEEFGDPFDEPRAMP